MAVSPISWQRNLNFCGSPRTSSESRRPLDVISVCTRPGQHVTDRRGPYQPQVPGGRVRVRSEMEACVDLYRGPRHSLGNPPVVGFSLGLGGVPGESPDAGQLSGTPLCVGRGKRDPSHVVRPCLSSRGLSPSRSPALQLGPQLSLSVGQSPACQGVRERMCCLFVLDSAIL